jgi:tetratricopeptide (TPR) repeat protein
VLPFGRNKKFVGRQTQLDRLITILYNENTEEDCPRAALVGLGGVGKTQIALECAFRIQSTSPTCSVFWVRATDTTSFDNAYRDIGQQLKIPGLEDDKADVKRLVKTRLSQESTGKWLMIVDNADDFEMFYRGSNDNKSDALSGYLPFSMLGAILFTTRDREAAKRYAGSNVIDIDEMDDRESRELLQRSLSIKNKQLVEDDNSVTALLKSLVNLPLAIMQAAAFLDTKGCTITEYLRIYRESSDNAIKLLSKDFEDIRRYQGIKNPITTTWLISFEQIQVRDPLAADYMAFISCIKEQDIPQDLLPPASEFDKTAALGTLKAFGFIKERLTGASYDMHRLVHMAMQNWLKHKDEWRSWNEKTLKQITNVFPWPQHENRAVWMMYLPHVECAITVFKNSFGEIRDLPWSLLHVLGWSYQIMGKYKEAEEMDRQALQLKETVLGKEHPDTLASMNNLANSLCQQGKYAEAEKIHRQTLQLKEILLGKEHPDTLMSMNNLAESLRQQGKYIEAEGIHWQTLQLKETVLGKEHPDTLMSMMNLTISLRQQGKYAEAEAMNRRDSS